MDKDNITKKMDLSTTGDGLMTSSTAMGLKYTKTGLPMRARLQKGKSPARADSSGKITRPTKEIFLIIYFMATVSSLGATAKPIKASGKTIKCTVWVSSPGLMAKYTTDSIKMILNMVKALSHGLMEATTQGPGVTDFKMEKEFNLRKEF